MADTPLALVTKAFGVVPAAFAALITTTNPAGIDGLWVINTSTDGKIELEYSALGVTTAIVLGPGFQEFERLIPGTTINYRYLAGAQPTNGVVYAGGFT